MNTQIKFNLDFSASKQTKLSDRQRHFVVFFNCIPASLQEELEIL